MESDSLRATQCFIESLLFVGSIGIIFLAVFVLTSCSNDTFAWHIALDVMS